MKTVSLCGNRLRRVRRALRRSCCEERIPVWESTATGPPCFEEELL